MNGFPTDLLQFLDLQWVTEQFKAGNGLPFLTWTFTVFAFACAIGYSTSYARFRYRAKRPVKLWFMQGLSKQLASAMLEALEADGMIPMGRFSKEIMGVHDAGLKVFVYSDAWEYVGSGSYYQLANEWRRYFRKPWRKRKLEKVAGK